MIVQHKIIYYNIMKSKKRVQKSYNVARQKRNNMKRALFIKKKPLFEL